MGLTLTQFGLALELERGLCTLYIQSALEIEIIGSHIIIEAAKDFLIRPKIC